MRNDLRIYRLTDKIMTCSDGQVRYEDALSAAQLYYRDKSPFFGLMVHTDMGFVAREYAKKLKEHVKPEEVKIPNRMIHSGFRYNDEQWREIQAWEYMHSQNRHKPIKIDHPMKMMPNAAIFLYEFVYSQVGTIASVSCTVCEAEARQKSAGDNELYRKLIDEFGAYHFVGEV